MGTTKQGKKAKNKGDKAEVIPKGAPGWMTTYGDMVTLLLTFFIMLFTVATSLDESKMQLIATAFKGSFGQMAGGMTLSPGKLMYMGQNVRNLPSSELGRSTARKRQQAEFLFKAEIQSRKIRVSEDERGFVISLGSDFFFKPGSAELEENDEVRLTLRKLTALLKGLQNKNVIRIEGHTDATPVSTNVREGQPFYESNWHLSSARSIAILQRLYNIEDAGLEYKGSEVPQNENGTPAGPLERERFYIAGYADTRPVADNDTPEGRRQNRRVDVVIVRQDVNFYNQRLE